MIIKISFSIALFIIIYLFTLSFITRQDVVKKESDRQLISCPNTSNCVLSTSSSKEKMIDPLSFIDKDPEQNWNALVKAIQSQGGNILINDGTYLHAIFTSTIFRFKDDLEAILTQDHIDIRSASRAGKSDLGQNKKRIERIRSSYQTNKTQ